MRNTRASALILFPGFNANGLFHPPSAFSSAGMFVFVASLFTAMVLSVSAYPSITMSASIRTVYTMLSGFIFSPLLISPLLFLLLQG